MGATATANGKAPLAINPDSLEPDARGVLRPKGRPEQSKAADRYGGGYKVRERQTSEGLVREVFALASGGSSPNNTTPVGAQVEAAKPTSQDRQRILEKCYELFVSDPLAGQIAETTRNFIFGQGTTATFEDTKAQAWVDRFRRRVAMPDVEKSMGAMSVYQGDIYMRLRPVTDELVAGRRKIEIPGDTNISLIDPLNIAGINHDPADPRNVYFYVFEYTNPDTQKVVSEEIPDHRYYDPEGNADKGCIIHLKFNSDPADLFGNPDYLRIGEWLENYKEYLRDGVVINKLYRSPCYDIKLIDGDSDDVAAAIARYKNWKIGSNAVHNDKEEWEILEFTGPNSSQSEARRAILLVIAAGVGFAEYMLADGSNANLASTTTQELPVLKKFESRQDSFRWAFEWMYQVVLMHAAIYGDLSEAFDDFGADFYWKGTVEFPPLVRAEEKAVQEVNTAAMADGIMSERTAARRLGLNLDDELRKMKTDAPKIVEAKGAKMDEEIKKGLAVSPREEFDVEKKASEAKARAAEKPAPAAAAA